MRDAKQNHREEWSRHDDIDRLVYADCDASYFNLLDAVEHVLQLDATINPDNAVTPAVRRQCALAINELRLAFDHHNAATGRLVKHGRLQ